MSFPGQAKFESCLSKGASWNSSFSQALAPILFTITHLYTWVVRGTGRVNCLVKEHTAVTLTRVKTQTTQSRVQCIYHDATAPLHWGHYYYFVIFVNISPLVACSCLQDYYSYFHYLQKNLIPITNRPQKSGLFNRVAKIKGFFK